MFYSMEVQKNCLMANEKYLLDCCHKRHLKRVKRASLQYNAEEIGQRNTATASGRH
jgi:hypothetical protein